MGLQLTLVLSCLFFYKALALKCYQCTAQTSGTCTDESLQIQCGGQCASIHVASTTTAGIVPAVDMQINTCAVSAQCVNGSVNLGFMKMGLNTKCCNTDLCNSNAVPALPQQSSNGKSCYTCDGNTCSGTVTCQGDENQCISATVNAAGTNVVMKGCASKTICDGISTVQEVASIGNVNCCEGNLCNSGNGIGLSFLLILGHLLSSFFIH